MPINDGLGIQTTVNLRAFDAAAADRVPMATISKENDATITRMGMDGKMQTRDANVGDKVYKDDVIKTGRGGFVLMDMADGKILSANSDSSIDMNKFAGANAGGFEGTKNGSLSAISGKIAPATQEPVRFYAPGMATGVRG